MALGLRAKLKALGDAAPSAPSRVRPGGLIVRDTSYPVPEGIASLPPVGLRRLGWSGRAFDVNRCLFLDTETTGLSGGAGTVAFLVGLGRLETDCFRVTQYLMRDYQDEPELLCRLADDLERCDSVCTFNGRTFDMPLLEARFTMARMRDRWTARENLDLLIPARRLWKLRLGSCRLSALEEKILGKPRADDLPGSEVPRRYFDYLKCGDLSLLDDILAHNVQDIATLGVLLVTLANAYDRPEELKDRRDLFSAGAALERQGELKSARALYHRAAIPLTAATLEALRGEEISGRANWRSYCLARCSNDREAMRAVLEQMIRRNQMRWQAHVEMAKLLEHRDRDPAAALTHARRALALAPEDERPDIARRIARLEEKLRAQNGG